MKVLVCGSRYWENQEAVRDRLSLLPGDTEIIHGAARGADQLAGMVGEQLGFRVSSYPAEWEKYGKRAGFVRNVQMLNLKKPDLVIAFWDGKSKGTAHTVNEARRRGVPVEIVT